MKGLISVTVGFAQNFYLLHLAVIFFRTGKKLEQPAFKLLVRLGRPGKELLTPFT
jgi:hypothetical protein